MTNESETTREKAGGIRLGERDYFLKLHDDQWPSLVPDNWQKGTDHLWRTIKFDDDKRQQATRQQQENSAGQSPEGRKPGALLREAILRFPSAPVYSIHRKHEYHFSLRRENYHTIRLLRRPWEGKKPPRVSRVYLIHNGLNELEKFGFYYDLAKSLLDDDAACLITPFPGHLTRYPLPFDYAERPLDSYLADAGVLFRQYLRFMIETQWLLSALVPLRSYRVVPGLDLLAEGDEDNARREEEGALAKEIHSRWKDAFVANKENKEANAGMPVEECGIKRAILAIRYLLGWEAPSQQRLKTIFSEGPSPNDLIPSIHVIGYSLGGFVAQSVFFSWPFAIASCTYFCSGGALREIKPKEFAHPEEWQTVMYALRFELESSMMQKRLLLKGRKRKVAGIAPHDFSYFYRLFHEVFLQEFPGTYRSKVSEYLRRLLFVVGGSDPIVSTNSVLKASPEEGINLIQVANLGHFVRHPYPDWQDFWLPKIAYVVKEFSKRGEDHLSKTLHDNWLRKTRTEYVSGHVDDMGAHRSPRTDKALASRDFQKELREMVEMLKGGGWLFLLRNDIPLALQGKQRLRRGMLHHEDAHIHKYLDGLRDRELIMLKFRGRVTIVVPVKLKDWFVKPQPFFSAEWDALSGKSPSKQILKGILRHFYKHWQQEGALRVFNPEEPPHEGLDLCNFVREDLELDKPDYRVPTVNTLPNLWISVSSSCLNKDWAKPAKQDRFNVEKLLVTWALLLRDEGGEEPKDPRIERLFMEQNMRMVTVSAVEFNPRFMGQRILEFRTFRQLLIHSARVCSFEKGGTTALNAAADRANGMMSG